MSTYDPKSLPSRQQNLPLFNPHSETFPCEIEATKVPPIDAQADAWFHEALALDSAEIFPTKRNYRKIVQLTRQAAERHHWKAMLNLASLYVGGNDPAHGEEDAVRLVEEAMRLSIPAAYDRMGTYYMNGTGVDGDATRAYAFWRRAAEMGNPQAMTFIGKKLNATYDDPKGGFWANIPVAVKMLECAYSQGSGAAASELSYMYTHPLLREVTREDKAHALKILHEGVKFGSEDCANDLYIEFDHPFKISEMVAPYIDKARGERYRVIGEALSFDSSDRFPNLDKVLPLPPAKLPPWNGDRDTLLNAARGVILQSEPPKTTAASQRSGRYFLDAAYALRDTGHETVRSTAPVEGFWQPTGPNLNYEDHAILAAIPPGLYRRDEPFPNLMHQNGQNAMTGIVWRRWDTVRHDPMAVEPSAAAGMVRIVPRPKPMISRTSESACPVSGTWQPWVAPDHPLHLAVNQYWRQAWLVAGQEFPHPERDWLLPIRETDITWHLLDAEPPNLLQSPRTGGASINAD